jgi:sortase (surface protein transpeptidase)
MSPQMAALSMWPPGRIWAGSIIWWDVGAMPGQIGNAVIAGHVNRPDGSPSTFTYLNQLNPGDHILVATAGGRTLTFVVTAKNAPLVYVQHANDPVMERIFGPSLTPNLNLMTCWGEWDGTEYNRRLVIYSTLVGPSPFPIPPGTVPLG